jgi:hypothetical protein
MAKAPKKYTNETRMQNHALLVMHGVLASTPKRPGPNERGCEAHQGKMVGRKMCRATIDALHISVGFMHAIIVCVRATTRTGRCRGCTGQRSDMQSSIAKRLDGERMKDDSRGMYVYPFFYAQFCFFV